MWSINFSKIFRSIQDDFFKPPWAPKVFFMNSKNIMSNRSNIAWYGFFKINNDISSEFDVFLSNHEKITFLISRWITFFYLRLCCLFWKLFITLSRSFASNRSVDRFIALNKSEKIASINASHFYSKWIFISLLCAIKGSFLTLRDLMYLYAWNTSLFFALFKKLLHDLFFASLIALK